MNHILENSYATEVIYNRMDYSNFNLENLEVFKNRYKILGIKYHSQGDKKYLDFNSNIFGELAKRVNIISVSYIFSNNVFLLLAAEDEFDLDSFFAEDFMASCTGDYLELSEAIFNEEKWKLDVIYNLLLNALAKPLAKITNVNGQLYMFAREKSKQINMMKFCIAKGLLRQEQVTFTSAKYSNNKNDTKYLINLATHEMRCFTKADYDCGSENIDKLYIRRTSRFKRYKLKYDNLKIGYAGKTKVQLLHDLIRLFNKKYEGMACLNFMKVEGRTQEIESYYSQKVKDEKLADYQDLGKINIVVAPDVEVSTELALLLEIFGELGLEAKCSKDIEPSAINMRIIHDKKYYQDNSLTDLKFEVPQNIILQHFTIERLWENIKNLSPIICKLLDELVMKKELLTRKIKDWSFGECQFYLCIRSKHEIGELPQHYLMTIMADGSFSWTDDVGKIDEDFTKLINDEEYQTRNGGFRNATICVVAKDGKFNEIVHTDYVPIMDKDIKEKIWLFWHPCG